MSGNKQDGNSTNVVTPDSTRSLTGIGTLTSGGNAGSQTSGGASSQGGGTGGGSQQGNSGTSSESK